MKTAWMLRQDGYEVPVTVHLYAEGDEDFASEAEVASFLLLHSNKDHDIAKYTLCAWMVSLIIDEIGYNWTPDMIASKLNEQLNSLPYKFPFPLSTNDYIKILSSRLDYGDFDMLMDFYDEIRTNQEKIWEDIKQSLNQQFSRVRFGGMYDTIKGNHGIWLRVSSVGFHWENTFFNFVSTHQHKLGIEYVTIVRDYESDWGDTPSAVNYFYKGTNGALYQNMPIDIYLHETGNNSPTFNAPEYNIGRGVKASARILLREGRTINEISQLIGLEFDIYRRFKQEAIKSCQKSDSF
jgi:hypothetical protein